MKRLLLFEEAFGGEYYVDTGREEKEGNHQKRSELDLSVLSEKFGPKESGGQGNNEPESARKLPLVLGF